MNECESDMKDAWPEILEMVCLKREGEKRSQRKRGGKEGERKERNRFTDFRQGGVSATNSKLDGK